jgi:type I restriction enzyme S subunit
VHPRTAPVETFEQAARFPLERSLACRRESRALAAIRDTLLPRLISGELKVRDIEKNLEDIK